MLNAIPFYITKISVKSVQWLTGLVYFWLVRLPLGYWKKAITANVFFEGGWATYVTARNLFEPLYQDYTVMGRVLGPIFRIGRVLIGIVIHLILLILEIIGFLLFLGFVWLAPVWFVVNLFIWNQ
ncbi:MAG: hypothetical protein GF332_00980 [Candidatus Moranbacteria bacterium]|nr:hypothetical protein [Candidatus Moranbacteria bacterium]